MDDGYDDDDGVWERVCTDCDGRRTCNVVTILVIFAMLFIAFVLGIYATDHTRRLWNTQKYDNRVRTYCLMSPSTALDAPSVEPYGVGMLRLDAGKRTAQFEALIYGDGGQNLTSIHVYGPREPGSINAPVAISISDDATGALNLGTEHVRLRAAVFESSDIEHIYRRPVFYYVGVSTAAHPHGTALRWSLGPECGDQTVLDE